MSALFAGAADLLVLNFHAGLGPARLDVSPGRRSDGSCLALRSLEERLPSYVRVPVFAHAKTERKTGERGCCKGGAPRVKNLEAATYGTYYALSQSS